MENGPNKAFTIFSMNFKLLGLFSRNGLFIRIFGDKAINHPFEFDCSWKDMVGVAQLVRAPDCGSGGCGFDSRLSPHLWSFRQVYGDWEYW